MKRRTKRKIAGFFKALLLFVFLSAAAAAAFLIMISTECGGSREIMQSHVNIPTTTTTTETTTTTTTTTTKATTTTTTTADIDYEMKLDISYVAQKKAVNPDVVGWIYVEDTVIDYPVVQGNDNDYYIHRDWTGAEAFAGCIYEDFRGDIDRTDLTLLYGHNMASGVMFSAITRYRDEEWGKTHRYFEVASEDKRYLYEVFSVNILNGLPGTDFPYWLPDNPTTVNLRKSEFEDYIKEIKRTSKYMLCKEKDLPKYNDRIIALQTCNSGSGDGIRCVVFAKCLGER